MNAGCGQVPKRLAGHHQKHKGHSISGGTHAGFFNVQEPSIARPVVSFRSLQPGSPIAPKWMSDGRAANFVRRRLLATYRHMNR
jgi:hypothetical protein